MSRISHGVLALSLLGMAAAPRPALAQANEPFLGEVMLVGFTFAPQGWAFCEGQVLSIAQNTALFSLLGTTYGGDGVSTFALPDLRGRVPVGQGQGLGLTNRVLGETGGLESVALTVAQMPAHTHAAMATNHAAHLHYPGGAVLAAKELQAMYSSTNPDVAMSSSAIGSTGAGEPHENMQPFLVMNYIIALEGVFPSRP
jgi:microcystin-dependent protein